MGDEVPPDRGTFYDTQHSVEARRLRIREDQENRRRRAPAPDPARAGEALLGRGHHSSQHDKKIGHRGKKSRGGRATKMEGSGQLGLGFSVVETNSVPQTSWEPPDLSSLPDRLFGVVGVDTETDDRGLQNDQGPGWAWEGGGRVVGYSVAADNGRWYLPIGHAEGNVDPDRARRWLRHVLVDKTQTKVFANSMYDLGWSEKDGVKIEGPIVDVQFVEPLLNEHRLSYELGSIAITRVGRDKNEQGMLEAGRAYGLGDTMKQIKARLAELPSWHVGPYAEEDAELPREIWAAQKQVVAEEGLEKICDLEHRLIPMYLDMRRRGVRIDVSRVLAMRQRLIGEVAALVAEAKRLTGVAVELWEPRTLALLLDELGVPYGRTPRSDEPQITNDTLARSEHPACRAILDARQKDKLRGTFLEGQILGQLHGDRVHGQAHPLKGDEGGTVTGRLSMSNPNLQFIPVRTEEGRLIRTMFLAEQGELWGKLDNNQQEVRLLVHFGVLCDMLSAIDAQRRYREDPRLDYHQMVAVITNLVRTRAKSLNFAIIYGRGIAETAAELNLSRDETKSLFRQHKEKMPFARGVSDRCQAVVKARGFLKTLLGRRQRFPLWEPEDWDMRRESGNKMLELEAAEREWPGIPLVRARLHKALNSLVQPSAADQAKKQMLDVWEAGHGGRVMIQVHDELDVSVPDERAGREIADVMQSAVRLEVPVVVDSAFGANWGEAK